MGSGAGGGEARWGKGREGRGYSGLSPTDCVLAGTDHLHQMPQHPEASDIRARRGAVAVEHLRGPGVGEEHGLHGALHPHPLGLQAWAPVPREGGGGDRTLSRMCAAMSTPTPMGLVRMSTSPATMPPLLISDWVEKPGA